MFSDSRANGGAGVDQDEERKAENKTDGKNVPNGSTIFTTANFRFYQPDFI